MWFESENFAKSKSEGGKNTHAEKKYRDVIIDHEAGEIICLVASVRLS